ncbi:MAG: type I pullulanase [Clostridiales bacterium]|nr:type I pullulanase [Clostridiales bacterium]
MKRITALLLIMLMLLGVLAGCKPKGDQPGPTDAPEETAAPDQGYEDYELPREDGCNQIVFYWYKDGVDYDTCDMWIWFPNADGRGYLFHRCEYGGKVAVNVPEDVTEVGFIVRRSCSDPGGTSWGEATKDYDGDRFAKITGELTEVYLKPGDPAIYKSDDGGKTLYQEREFTLAGMISLTEIKYTVVPAARITSLDQVKVMDGEREIPVTGLSSLNNEVVMGTVTVGEELDVSKIYTLEIEGYGKKTVLPTEVFDSAAFNDKYAYDGELGAIVTDPAGLVEFRLWAPTASAVSVNLYQEGNGGEAYQHVPMTVLGAPGVWLVSVSDIRMGTYYTYTVTTALGTFEVVDPYAKAVGVNGDRGMVVDLDSTDPEGWENDTFFDGIASYPEAVIWEVHVRDFSNKIDGSAYPGKYLAFTESGLKNSAGEPVGIDYLKQLGITHVHLQPVYDYATVDESSDRAQFNWGYDPKNYNAPEGSYSTDPYHGEVRINEFKHMVMALHEAGIGVIMDVVYNHTYSADSNFSKIVPYYYYRYDGTGKLSNGSGCGNETASERAMFRKFMVDSVSYWASEYHIDGFRFDLMALHDIDTMQAVEKAVHEINPKAMIYGEGWTGGASPLRENLRANQTNISKIVPSEGAIGGVAVFNDVIRDGLKGSVFDPKDRGYINGKEAKLCADQVIFGIVGGKKGSTANWGVENSAVINYMACHDNNTLWDKLMKSNPEASDEERLLMNRLGAGIIMIGKGVPFFLAGEEMLRTKGGNSNSYNASDEVNNIVWEALVPDTPVMQMHDYYMGLIEMRKANPFLTDPDVEPVCEVKDGNVIEIQFMKNKKLVAVAVINPGTEPIEVSYQGLSLKTVLDGWNVSPKGAGAASETVTVEGKSVFMATVG